MKNIILGLLVLFFGSSFTDTEELVDSNLHGVWQEATENEFVRIRLNENFETAFQRVYQRQLVSWGTLETSEGVIYVSNDRTQTEYELQYVFSPSGETVVITKPNSTEAWVFHKVGE